MNKSQHERPSDCFTRNIFEFVFASSLNQVNMQFFERRQPVGPYRRRLLKDGVFAPKPLNADRVRAVKYLGRHGSLHLIEVLYRGKRTLQYVREPR